MESVVERGGGGRGPWGKKKQRIAAAKVARVFFKGMGGRKEGYH